VNIVAMVYGNMVTIAARACIHARLQHRRARAERRRADQRAGRGRGLRRAYAESIQKMKRGKLAKIYRELDRLATKLEKHFKDVQDVDSHSSTASCTCCRRVARNGPEWRRFGLRRKCGRGLITETKRSARAAAGSDQRSIHGGSTLERTVLAKGLPLAWRATGESCSMPTKPNAQEKGHDVILVRPRRRRGLPRIVAARAILTARAA